MSKRAERRYHYLRMKKRVRTIFYIYSGDDCDDYMDERWVCRLVNNICHCSCFCCGNPRKWWHEKTKQEMIADIDFDEQLKET